MSCTQRNPYWKSPHERGEKIVEDANKCIFSPCERYRYALRHRWDELYIEKALVWIGLNPSTADARVLDPTLRRIRIFTQREGFTAFWMLNLFALRSPYPEILRNATDPVGKHNDRWIARKVAKAERIVVCWGNACPVILRGRIEAVHALLEAREADVCCLGRNRDGTPKHPLYLSGRTKLEAYAW